jgi:uncharacterized integral membrane protein
MVYLAKIILALVIAIYNFYNCITKPDDYYKYGKWDYPAFIIRFVAFCTGLAACVYIYVIIYKK